MSIDNVKKEIISDAKKKAEVMIKEAERQKKEMLADAEHKASKVKEELEVSSKKTIDAYDARVEVEASSAVNRKKLSAEQEIIDTTFKEALEEMEKLSVAKKKTYYQKLITNAKKSFEFEKVLCAKADVSILKENKAEETNIKGGVILVGEGEETRLDLSFTTLINEIKRDDLDKVAKILIN